MLLELNLVNLQMALTWLLGLLLCFSVALVFVSVLGFTPASTPGGSFASTAPSFALTYAAGGYGFPYRSTPSG